MKVWITKYALTKGIREFEGELRGSAVVGPHFVEWFYPPDWHKSREDAIAWAEKMRQKKIASLEKQIDRLKSLKFE